MAKTLAEMKAAMQKELEEEQKRLEREEGKRFSSSQTSGNSSSGKTSNVAASLNNAAAKIEKVPTKAEADAARANKEADLIGAKDSAKLNETNLNNRDEKKKKAQEEKSLVWNLAEAAKLDSDVKTEKGITLENRDEIKAQKQKEYFEDTKEPFQNIIENAKNDKEIKERVNPQNREEIREEKREDVWKSKEDDSDAETLLKGLGNRARSVPGKLIQSGAKAFYDVTDDTVKGYEEGDEITLANRDAAKAAKIKENSAWILNPAREKAAEVAAGNKAEGVSAMATEQLDKLRAKTDNALVQDLISAADGGATMLGYMALPFGTKYLSLYMGASQAVDTYNAGRANGQSKEEAAARGITDGAISMAIESIGGIGKIPGVNAVADVVEAAAAKNFISNLAVQALQEGGEGFAEAVLNYVGNVVNDLLFKGEIQTSFSFSEALHNAFVEGLSGAMFGAGSFGVAKISGVPGLDASLSEVSQDIIAGVKSVLNIDQTKANPPEALIKAKPPVPFEGTAEPGTEAGIVADKISEIENRPISEAEKAAKIEEVMEAVAETTQSQEAINEAGKVAEFYKNRQAEFDEAVEIGKKLGISVELDPNIAGNGIHTSDGRIIINPNTENPALQVFVHELTHDIETSGLYESFSKKILEHASQIGLDVNKIREMVIEDYKAAGHDLTDTQADAEIVAKYCEQHLFTDEKAIDRLLSEDRSLFQKIKDWISDMIVKFKGAPEEKFLLEAERLYEKALATRGEVSGIDSEAESVGRGFDEMAAKARDQEYSEAIETGDMETAQRLTDEAAKAAMPDSKIVDENGNLRKVYHGTSKTDFYTFDPRYIGTGSGDVGYFGRGFYFAYTKGEAASYGARRIIPAYINIKNPFNFEKEIYSYNGEKPKFTHTLEAVAFINFAEKFPEIAKNTEISVSKKGSGEYENINLVEFAKAFKDVINNKEFEIKEITDSYGEKRIVATADRQDKEFTMANGKIHKWVDYGFEQSFYYDNPTRLDVAYLYLENAVFDSIDIYTPTHVILDNSVEFTETLKNKGYDGTIQSEDGDEVVAFYPEQIKTADPVTYDDDGNVIPLSERFKPEEKDFRYSTGRSFDEMAGEAKAEHGVSEGISAEITDSAKRVIEQMRPRKPKVQSSTSQVNPEPESTKLVDVPQSKKSERIEKRYQKAVEDGVASVFGIDRRDIKNDIRPILNEIAADVKDGKTITDEQIDALYKQAFDDGYISEEFPQYQQLRKYVREKPFYVSPETRHEFGDDEAFREFARENFGNFKVSTDPRNRSLDDFYKTMAEMAPEFFTEGETDPRTQLEDISDFMNQTKKQYFGLSEVYSGTELADFESWAKKELKAYMNEFGKGLDNVRRYELDRQIKATNKAREMDTTASFEQAKAAFSDNRVFEAQKAVEKAKQNQLLNDMDNLTVKKLLEGTISEADVIALGGNVEGILEVYNAEKAYKAARAPFDKYKAAYKTALQHDAIELTTLSDEFTDKKIGAAYSRETAERNVKDIAGKSAGKIIEEYFTPVHENEAMKTRWIKELNQRVADLELGRMNRWERAYAQMIGENAAYIAEGRMTKHDQNEHDVLNERISALLDKHGKKIDKAKCEKAAAGLMGIYEDILEEWNDERIRRGQEPLGKIQNYFPHFTETRPENTIQKIFSWFGFDIGNSKLPTDIAGRTADRKPQSKYNPHAQRRTTDVTDYDIFKGFDGYVRAVGDNIFHTEDIQKLRTLSDTIRTKYSSAEIEKRIEEIRSRDDLSEADKETLIADTFKSEPGAYHLSNFVVWLDEYTNILAGKKSRGDREAEYQMGREIYDISKALEGRIASNMIGYNLSTPVMNLVPMFQAVADVPPQDILSSFVQTGLAAAKGDSFISDNSDFLTNRFGVDSVYKKNYGLFTSENVKDAFAKISDGGGLLMEFVDRIAAESLVRARYEQNIKKGMDKVSAFSEADSWAAGLMADRSTGALPTVFNIKNPAAKALTMFQIEVNNQYSYIFKDAGKYKWKTEGALNTITGQLAFWVAMRICNGLAEELLGRDNVVPDPIGMSAEALAKIVKGEKVGNVLLDTGKATLEQLPFVGGLLGGGRIPLSTALPDVEQLVKGFDKEIPWEKRGQILGEELLKPLSYFFLPSGAGQAWKTGKGVKQLIEGGAFGMENDGSEFMKFPQEYDPASVIKTLLFGQYASDRGTEYIDSNFKSLSSTDTANMRLANEYGVSNEDFYDTVLGLKEFKTKEEKQDALFANEDLSAREKGIIDWVLFGDGKGFPEATRDYTSEQAFWESGLSNGEIRLNEDGYNREEIRLIEYAFEKGKDKVSTIEWIQKTMDCTEAEAYEIYQRRQGKWIDDPGKLPAEEQARAKGAAELYGMSEENFLKVLNFKGYGIDEEGKFSDKAEDVVPKIIEATGWNKEKAEEYYNRVFKYDYSIDDLEEEQAKAFGTSKDWYGVEEKGYFTARNIIKTAEGTTDKYGNTVSGSKKEAAIEKIAEQLKIDETEATIYYLAANGDLAFSKNDLSSSHQEDLEAAKKEGWTERQYLDAVNLLKVSGATKKDDIIKTLMDGGASYEMAQGFYNLRQNKDYDRTVSTGGSSGAGYSYGMKTQKQADKGDYFLANYNSDGSLSAKDIANWYAAAAGCNKKQEYLDAYQSAGATYSQALQFYNLMRGYDKNFNSYYKQKG